MIGSTELTHLPGRTNPIYLEGRLLPLTAAQARALDLKDGDIIQALVRARGGDDLSLLIRGRQLNLPQTPATLGWQPGQSVWLQAQATAAGAVGLQALDDAPPPPGPPQSGPAFFSRVAHLLFRPPGMAQLAQLFQPGVLDALLQASGRADLQARWAGMQLSMAQLTPQALGQAMASAMGSEVWLGRGQMPPVAEDPKQLLRRLMAALREKDGLQGVDGLEEGESLDALDRLRAAVEDIEASQVQAVQAHGQRELLFSVVLPFADADPVELQFRRGPRQGGEPPPLTVNVHSRNRELGELWLQTQLHGLDRVDLTMWALDGAVATQARARAAELGQQLAESGLAMQSFQVVHGPRPEGTADWAPSGRGLVVDISA